jgi:tetratricopeptide (TPR) repeat protein/S1-C subfamily serine protease
MKTPLLTAAIFLTAHLLPVTASPPPNIPTTYLAQTADDGGNLKTPQEVQTQARKITVRITSADNGGSGVLIAKKGTTYLVLTNKHVVGKAAKFQIQTPDGQKHAAQLVPNTQIDPKYDAVLLQFTSRQTYTLANLKYDTGTPLTEGREIYSTGFPFDSERLRFTTGAVTQLSDVPLEDGTQIGYITNPGQKGIRQGMSGGPVLDGNGAVIGINTIGAAPILPSYTYFDGSKPLPTKATEYAKANWGVPIYNVLTQLNPDILYNYENLPKVQRQVTPQGYMAEINRKARKMTVRIEYQDTKNGSGVIVAKEGNTYYVLTAKHVVWDSKNKTFHSNIKTITDDQESYAIQPSDITLAEGQDLAVVKFNSKVNYLVATLAKYSHNQSAIAFAAGYPAREKIDSPLWQWQLNPGWVFDKEKGKLETQDKQSFSNGYDLIYSNISYGGMSGGAIFDTDGRVIGIHGKAEGSGDLILGKSLGISIQNFIGISNRLQITNLLKISTELPKKIDRVELATITTVWFKIATPQAESSGEQWLQYGNQLYRIGKTSEAVVAFDKAIARDRQYKLSGNYGKSLVLMGIDNFQALTAISTAILAVPVNERIKHYYLWKQQSIVYRNLGKYDDALRSIEEALRLEQNDLILLNQKALLLYDKKQYKGAIAIYDAMIGNQPELYIYINRGNAKSALGQKQEAIADYDLAISINPNYVDCYVNRGTVKFQLKQKQAAIADFDRAIEIDPNDAEIFTKRARVKYDLGQKQAAIADCDRAISINPNYAEGYAVRGAIKIVLLGNKAGGITDWKRAAELFRKQGNIDDYRMAIELVKKIEE